VINFVVSTGFCYQFFMVLVSLSILYQPMAEKITAAVGNKYLVAEIEGHLKWAVPVGFLTLLASTVLLTRYS
jgi:uncharacterized membrane protein (DUF485 family)